MVPKSIIGGLYVSLVNIVKDYLEGITLHILLIRPDDNLWFFST